MSRFRRRISIDFAAINREALPLLPAILQRLLPNGRREGHEYVALNPTPRRPSPGIVQGQLANRPSGPTSRASDKGGDPSRLVAFIEDCKQGEAARKLARMLGLDGGGRRHG